MHRTLRLVSIVVGPLTSLVAMLNTAAALPVPSAALWLDAADVDGDGNSGNNPLSGAPISTWVDKANTVQGVQSATQGTVARQPTYITGFQNGMPVVRFDGVNDALATTNVSMGPFS